MNNPVVLVVGTRPEGIKIAPLYFALKEIGIPTILCSTFQHTSLLEEVFSIFKIEPDIKLNLMRPNQDLFYITTGVLEEMKKVYTELNPHMVIVQGDTTTTMSAALAAFYLKIPVGHVEAGLRTGDIYSPFPEEMNRKIVGSLARLHFAPTGHSVDNLLAEGIKKESIFYVGNTVKDALRLMSIKIKLGLQLDQNILSVIKNAQIKNKKIVLVTAHRRESFNGGILNILNAIKEHSDKFDDVQFIYPSHPNPNVLEAIEKSGIKNCKNVFMCAPLSYPNLVYVLESADVIITDSGGIQEEAACLKKPVIIARDNTDRPEPVWAGYARVVGTDREKILHALSQFLYNWVAPAYNEELYGDGFAAEQIARIIEAKIKPVILSERIESKDSHIKNKGL